MTQLENRIEGFFVMIALLLNLAWGLVVLLSFVALGRIMARVVRPAGWSSGDIISTPRTSGPGSQGASPRLMESG